jgi:hypothetical protein
MGVLFPITSSTSRDLDGQEKRWSTTHANSK